MYKSSIVEAQVIAQTLHGYDQGHRLLAHGGDVSDAELGFLDRLSDLSGYVPLGTTFDAYHTGFPCGRYYAFACTWPDTSATRAGTVLTHTLLVPLDALHRIHDLWALGRWHRRPSSTADRDPYAAALPDDPEVGVRPSPVPTIGRAFAVVALWFGQPDRPVLWMEEARPDDVTRYLWGLLWPEARRRFAFCTFALQVRHLRKRPFGFLALPPSARGSFHERARSGAWWREGEALSGEPQKRDRDGWAQAVLDRGAEATWAIPRFCEAHGLPGLEEADLPAFCRFVDLEEPARLRLTAARARTDLLLRLWPDIAATHGVAKATLCELLRRQPDALMSPRPFWDLDDFLGRRVVAGLAEADEGFAVEVVEILGREVRRRLAEAGLEAVAGLRGILARELLPRFRQAIIDAIRAAIESAGDDAVQDGKAAALVAAVVESMLTRAVLGALAPERRARVALQARRDAATEALPALDDHVLSAATGLGDPMLAAEVWFARDRPMDAMRAAARIVAELPGARPEALAPVVARLDAPTRLAWALEVTDASLAAWAGDRGADAAIDLGIGPPEVLQRCAAAPNGEAVLLSRFARLPPSELRAVLGDVGTAIRVLALALAEGSSRMGPLVDAAGEALEDEELFSAAVAAALVGASTSPAAARFAENLAPRLVREIVNGRWTAERRGTWLGIAPVREALERTPPAMLFGTRGARDWDADCLPNVAHATAQQVRSDASVGLGWIANLLDRPLASAGRKSVDRARTDLEALLAVPRDRDGWLLLAARILWAVRRTDCTSAHSLVELAFPVLYVALGRDAASPGVRAVLSSAGSGWDVAKSWRHWLLDAWISNGWPPASFLRCMADDEALFLRIAKRARWKWRGRDFLRDLAATVTREPEFAAKWLGPIERALGSEDLKVDYD